MTKYVVDFYLQLVEQREFIHWDRTKDTEARGLVDLLMEGCASFLVFFF